MSESQVLTIKIKGLYTSPNNLSAVPQGALEVANNVVINSESLVTSRRGQTQYGAPLAISTGEVNKLFNYSSSIIANYNNKMAYDSGGGNFVDYEGTFLPPSELYKMRSLEAQRNFYFTTDKGVYKIDTLTSIPRAAGAPRGLGGKGDLDGTSGFLLEDTAVAYRIVWGYRDFNNNLIVGAPSQRLVVQNPAGSGGSRDVFLTFPIPASITTEYFYQIYRSLGSVNAAAEPTDDLYLVLEGNVSGLEINGKLFGVVDRTPYSLMGATLYTSPSQQGIAAANYEPPLAMDMDIFKNCAFYANTTGKQNLTLSLISVGSPSLGYLTLTGDTTAASNLVSGLSSTSDLHVGMRVIGSGIDFDTYIDSIASGTQVNLSKPAVGSGAGTSLEFQDRFTLDFINYWAGSTQDKLTNTFLVETAGTPGQNIALTSQNLLEIINTTISNNTVYGYYISGVEDLPGKMYFEYRDYFATPFFATSTAGESFTPNLPIEQAISAIATGFPAVVTTPLAHGLSTGDVINIYFSNSTPLVDGKWEVTVLSPTTFSIPETVAIAGTFGFFIADANYVLSTAEARQNRVFVSKNGQVEAVPLTNFFDIGSANFPIQRVVALRDGIFFFKNDGIFRLSGETIQNFVVDLVDNTVTLKAPESAVPFNNQVFCMTTQGVCAVTDSGVQIMSVPIENTLLELSSEQYTNFSSASFAVAYESARQYLFFTVTETDDAWATQAFVFNSLTNTWTRWEMERTCGVVGAVTNKLYMAEPLTGQILIERKNYANSDYADKQFTVNITTVTSNTQIALSSVENVEVGMTLVSNFREAIIRAIDGLNLTITPTNGLDPGSAIVYEPILNEIQWAPIDAENPGILKQFSEISLFFRDAAFRAINATFSTNISVGEQTVLVVNVSTQGWGQVEWGTVPWGGSLGGQNALRTYVPREKQRCSWLILSLSTEQAFTGFSLQGVSLILNTMSSRFR